MPVSLCTPCRRVTGGALCLARRGGSDRTAAFQASEEVILAQTCPAKEKEDAAKRPQRHQKDRSGLPAARESTARRNLYSSLQDEDEEAAGAAALTAEGGAVDRAGTNRRFLEPIQAAVAQGGRPSAGCRTWFQLDEINSSNFRGRVMIALHWTAQPEDMPVSPDAESAGIPKRKISEEELLKVLADRSPSDRRKGWRYTGDYHGPVPALSLAYAENSQVFESSVYVRPHTHEVCMWIGMMCTISAPLNIRRFPFDRHTLRVGFTSRNFCLREWSMGHPPILGEILQGDINAPICRIDSEDREWNLDSISDVKFFKDMEHSSYFRVVFRVERCATHYVLNFALPTYFLVLVSAAVTSLDPVDQGADRLGVCLTLLLTLMAQKLVLAQAVPVCSYSTWLDNYVLLSMLWMMTCVGQVAVSTRCMRQSDECAQLDLIYHSCSAAAWTLLHACFLVCHSCCARETWPAVQERMTRGGYRQTVQSC